MANNRNNRNNRNKRANNKRVSSDNEQQLELIKINVDKVKKDVSDISTFTKKEIDVITKRVDDLIFKMEKSINAMTNGLSKMTAEQQKAFNGQLETATKLLQISNESIKNSKEQTKQSREQTKEVRKQVEDQQSAVDNWLKVQSQKQDKASAINSFMHGDISAITSYNNKKKQSNILDRMKSVESDNTLSAADKKSQLSGLVDQYKSLDASTAKMKAAATIFETSVKVIKGFADIWIARFETGLDRIAQTYEDTYQKQAVLTGINESQYQQAQKDMRDNIKQMGLQDNLAVTEVMNATSDYISKGITDFGKAQEMGQIRAIGNVLAPYLDTQSDAFITMSQSLGPKFAKNVMGLQTSVAEQVGQSRFIMKNLDKMVDDTQYMSLAARKSLMSAEEQTKLELIQKATNTTTEQAMQIYTDVSDLAKDRYGAMKNGNTSQKIAAASNETSWEGLMREYLGSFDVAKGFDTNTAQGQFGLGAVTHGFGINGVIGYNNEDYIDLMQEIGSASGEKLTALLKKYGISDGNVKSGEESYEDKIARFSEGQYTTALEEKNILAENLAVDLAIYKEMWPDLFKVIKELGGSIIGALAMYLGGKLFSKVFDKIGGKLFGKASEETVKQAAKTGGSKLLSYAAPAAQIAGGGLAIYDGVKDIGTDFEKARSDSQYSGYAKGRTAMDVVEIGAGATAVGAGAIGAASTAGLITAGAAVPVVGWAALAVAGVAAVGKAAFDFAEYCEKSSDATEELNAEKEQELKTMRNAHRDEMNTLNEYNERIQATGDVETAKKLIMDAGIATEAELQGEQYKSIEALKQLTQEYVDSKQKMNENSEKYLNDLKTMTNSEQQGFISDYLKKYGEDMDYKDLKDKDKNAINEYGQQMQKYIEELVASGDIDKEENKHAKYMWEHGILERNYSDYLTEDDYRALFREGTNADRRVVGKKMLTQDKYYNSLMANGSNSRDVLGNKYKYNTVNGNEQEISNKLGALVDAASKNDKSAVESYVSALKILGINSLDDLPQNAKTDVQNALNAVGIPKYATGIDYVNMNGQLAYLHEGEAVLTKSAADLLRSSTNESISSAHGVASILSESKMATKDSITSIVSAITNQTTILVAKIEAIYNVLVSNNRNTNYSHSMTGLKSN